MPSGASVGPGARRWPAGWASRRRFGWPRAARLLRSPDHDAVHRGPGRWASADLLVRYVRTDPAVVARFGWAVSKKVGNAVVRNRVRRRLREAIRLERGDLAGVDMVFVARSTAAAATAVTLRAQVHQAIQRVRKGR